MSARKRIGELLSERRVSVVERWKALLIDRRIGEMARAGDQRRLSQVISNLLDSAVQHARQSSTVDLKLSVASADAVMTVPRSGGHGRRGPSRRVEIRPRRPRAND